MKVAKDNGTKEKLDEGKLWHSLYYPAREAHHGEDEAVDLADKAKHRILDWVRDHEDSVVTTQELRNRAEEVLEDLDEDVALMYDKHLDIN
jgi:transcriptional regulator NrdR family protein